MNIKELLHLPAHKLKRLVALKTQMARLEQQLANVIGAATPAPGGKAKVVKAKRKMSAAARRKIALAAKARWAKVKAAGKKRL